MPILLFIIQASHNSAGSGDGGLIITCDLEVNIVRVYATEFTEFLPRALD